MTPYHSEVVLISNKDTVAYYRKGGNSEKMTANRMERLGVRGSGGDDVGGLNPVYVVCDVCTCVSCCIIIRNCIHPFIIQYLLALVMFYCLPCIISLTVLVTGLHSSHI